MAEPRTAPGRAGRARTHRSLAAARRGADLLDRKLRVLRSRHEVLVRAEQAERERWHTGLRRAERWFGRGLLLDGEDALGAYAAVSPARLDVTWTATMGVRHPQDAACTAGERDPDLPDPANTALLHAAAAYAEALRAAGHHAAARAAVLAVEEEMSSTRRRVRALRRHWIPRLEAALADADAALEQAEHEDAVRRRWAAGPGHP
ncbi:V-type ATP synthase subunit D [Streptomyces sp. MS06]|uniref:V-type ATP synthase subunit D n=1 Tax=Streptomyces sp. MS06 TaxID=3385974 RepID=UPI0039A3419D